MLMTLADFVRTHAAPVLRSGGFKGSGLTFRMHADSGDCSLISFHQHRVDSSRLIFDVTLDFAPISYWAWLQRSYPATRNQDSSGSVAKYKVIPPGEAAYDPISTGSFRSRWAFPYEVDPRELATSLQESLQGEAIPMASRMLDRSALRECLRNPISPMVRIVNLQVCEFLLSAFDGSAHEDRIRSMGEAVPPSIVDWVISTRTQTAEH